MDEPVYNQGAQNKRPRSVPDTERTFDFGRHRLQEQGAAESAAQPEGDAFRKAKEPAVYSLSEGEVFARFGTGAGGLSKERVDVLKRKGFLNELEKPRKLPLVVLFLLQLKNVMTIILIVSAGLSAFFQHWVDTLIIAFVVVLNAVLGVAQEYKAEKAIEALSSLAADKCKVKRDGAVSVIPSRGLVPGDLVYLEAGDVVPADMRITECAGLQADESALTGESLPVSKTAEALSGRDIPVGDRKNIAHTGCFVTAGRGAGIVTAVGMETEMGRIAGILNKTRKEATPLSKELNRIGRIISIAVVVICLAVFILNIAHSGLSGDNMVQYFLLSVSLAVAAIPEGLSTVVTLLMALGITRMSKRNAIVRHLLSIETLGCTEVICSDKTGTLTQNRMTVTETFAFSGGEKQTLIRAAALCNDCFIFGGKVTGDPTEAALLLWAQKHGADKARMDAENKRVFEIPFTSQRKLMTTVGRGADGMLTAYAKGAPDVLLEKCACAELGGKTVPLTAELKRQITEANSAYARKGCRVLGFAVKAGISAAEFDSCEKDMCFLGLAGMTDPVRPEAAAAILKCKAAGIKPVMITGDHIETAVSVGVQLGLITGASEAMTGKQLDALSDREFAAVIHKYAVYARVSPENKVRIVKAWKALGKVSAMTGDGVNDAPALKSADIGIGMGISGTDVTKKAADIVLADDNFATIVIAVEEGRKIYDNIKKTVQFLLSTNLSEVFTLLIASLFGLNMISAVQILWINLVTDTVPAVGLGLEPSEKSIMDRPPRRKGESLFSGNTGFNILWQSLLMTLLTCAAFTAGALTSPGTAMTMAFTTLSLTQIAHSFNLKQFGKTVFCRDTLKNKTLIIGGAVTFILSVAIIYIPGLNTAFNAEPLSVIDLMISLLLAFLIIPAVELTKLFGKKRFKKQKSAGRKAGKARQA